MRELLYRLMDCGVDRGSTGATELHRIAKRTKDITPRVEAIVAKGTVEEVDAAILRASHAVTNRPGYVGHKYRVVVREEWRMMVRRVRGDRFFLKYLKHVEAQNAARVDEFAPRRC